MDFVFHTAASRGLADHGWLNSRHTFSFAHYYDPDRVQFGALRVLNDDIVDGGMGFGRHPHNNMEIISIPLKGDLEHQDSMGHKSIIREGDVQIMSAGTGVAHSEYNANKDRSVNFLQIWILPAVQNIDPKYDQRAFLKSDRLNQVQTIINPNANDPKTMWINQNAFISLSSVESGKTIKYKWNDFNNGVYLFVIEGGVKFEDNFMGRRDAVGIWNTENMDIRAEEDSELLIMEVPLS